MTRFPLLLLFACGSSGTKPATITNAAEPAWPVGGDTVHLTWVVSPAIVPHPKWPDTLLAPVELEVSIGNVTRRVKLEPQQGSLFPYNQPVCQTTAYPLEPGEVAKITFYEGGAGGYFVRRTAQGELEVGSWSWTDGACAGPAGDPVACPRGETIVTRIQVLASITVQEAIVTASATGGRTALECAPSSP